MLRTVNIGIIGCGNVTENFHLPSLKTLSGARVVALSDIDDYKLERLAGMFNVRARCRDPYELIGLRDVEAVAVCAPSEFHYTLGKAVLDSGKHLFMEKPPALSLEDSAELAKKARGSSLKATTGLNLRTHRNAGKAKEIIAGGALGAVKSTRSVMSVNDAGIPEWRKKRALGGGSIMDLGIHHFDLIRYLFDSEALSLQAVSVSGEIEDETAHVSVELSNGILASSVFSYVSGQANEIEIYGSRGIMKLSLYDISGIEIWPSDVPQSGFAAEAGRAIGRISRAAANARALSRGGIFRESYYREWEGFIGSVINDTNAGCSLEDGVRALEIALAAARSASTGSPVRLSDKRTA